MNGEDVGTEVVERLKGGELNELCQATEEALAAGIGFGWVRPPDRARLEAYWRGVLVVPQRVLIVGRREGVIAGSVQVVLPVPNDEARAFSVSVDTHFVAPWARGHGLAKALLEAAEGHARGLGYSQVCLDVRVTQERAIRLYEACGYERWGTLPDYHDVDGERIAGHFYRKKLAGGRGGPPSPGGEGDA